MRRRCSQGPGVAGATASQRFRDLCRAVALGVLMMPMAQAPAAAPHRLLRHWPDPWSAREAISGDLGIVLPVLPASLPDLEPVPFGAATGWAQLQPALPSEPFTLSCWVLARDQPGGCLISQEDPEVRWHVERWTDGPPNSYVVVTDALDPEECLEAFTLRADSWHLLGLTRRADGTIEVRLDGRHVAGGRTRHGWPRAARWLCLGNVEKGDLPWQGSVRDLRVLEGELADSEWLELAHLGPPPHRPPEGPAFDLARENPELMRTLRPVRPTPEAAPSLEHRRYTTEDGLPSNSVQAVLQTRSGHLWVGTEDGLARFDGRDFQTFHIGNQPALAATGGDVADLAEDAAGTLWAGTFGGLLRIRGTEITAYTEVLPERFVVRVAPAGDGSVWIAGFRNQEGYRGPCRVRRFDPTGRGVLADTVIPGQVRRLVPDGEGLWVLAEEPDAVYWWPRPGAPIRAVATAMASPPYLRLAAAPVPGRQPVVRWGPRPGEVGTWLEFRPGVGIAPFHFLLGPGPFPVRPGLGSGPVQASDAVWIGAVNGLCRVTADGSVPLALAEPAANLEIACLTPDRDGGVWFGTPQDGLHFLRERPVRLQGVRQGLPGEDVQTVCLGVGGVPWVGTEAGLSCYRQGLWSLQSGLRPRTLAFTHGPDPLLLCGLKDRGRRALLLNGRAAPDSWGPELGWFHPNAVLPTPDGALWVACALGLTWMAPAAMDWALRHPDSPAPLDLPDPHWRRWKTEEDLAGFVPQGLVLDADGSVWTGTLGGGLWHATPQRLERIPVPDAGSTRDAWAVPLQVDREGALWFATQDALNRRRGSQIDRLTVEHGLPEDRVSGLVEVDDGVLWIAGRRGVHRLERAELEAYFAGRKAQVRSVTLGVSEGLSTPECASGGQPVLARASDGRLWVATRSGVAVFHPKSIQAHPPAPPVAIESLRVRGRLIPTLGKAGVEGIGEVLVLPPGSGSSLEFHCSAVSLTAAERVRFRHRMEGHDAEWSAPTDLRVAFYTNLRPGEYTFRTEAFHLHAPSQRRQSSLRILIRAHPWETRTFQVTLLLLAVSAAAFLHRRRLQGLRRLEELRRKESLAEERARIAADLHDDIGAALTQITMLGEIAKARSGPDSPAKPPLDRALGIARDVTGRMSDLVWSTQSGTEHLDNLVAHLREQVAAPFEAAGIPVRLAFPTSVPDLHLSSTFRRNVLLVVKETVQNILKHAEATAAEFELTTDLQGLTVRIAENGRGFDPSCRGEGGHGLTNMRRRIEELGGTWDLQSRPGEGTQLRFRVPWAAPESRNEATGDRRPL